MAFANTNNLIFEGCDFTENFISKFSKITLGFGIEGGLIDQILSTRAAEQGKSGKDYSFQFVLPNEVLAVAEVEHEAVSDLSATVNFFAASELGRPMLTSFDGYAAIAFLRFRFKVSGRSFIERHLGDAEIFVCDGWADAMFVAMIEAEDPNTFSAEQ